MSIPACSVTAPEHAGAAGRHYGCKNNTEGGTGMQLTFGQSTCAHTELKADARGSGK